MTASISSQLLDEWLLLQTLIERPERFQVPLLEAELPRQRVDMDALAEQSSVGPAEKKQLIDYYQHYRSQTKVNHPRSPREVGGIEEKRWQLLTDRNFNFDPWNRLAERAHWPRIDFRPGHSRDACIYYNADGRSKAIIETVQKQGQNWADLLPDLVETLSVGQAREGCNKVDIFLIAGSATSARAKHAARLMLKDTKESYAITMGSVAQYMGDLKVQYSEAEAAALSMLAEGRGLLLSPRLLLEAQSRVTRDHAVNAVPFIETVAKVRGRPLHLGVVTSNFHSARFTLLIDTLLGHHLQVASIEPFFAPVKVTAGSRIVGYVLNEYLKILYELCVVRT